MIPIVKLKARRVYSFNGMQESTTRTSWMANNAIPDSIIMNMTDRSLVPPGREPPKGRSTKVGLTSKNTLRILNTIKAVIRAFTDMDKTKLVNINGSKGSLRLSMPEVAGRKFNPIDPSYHLSSLMNIAGMYMPLFVN